MVAGSPNNRLGDALASLVVEQAGVPDNTPAGRRKLEAMIDETERLARLGHWEWDEIEDRCLYCSKQLAHLHGYSVETFLAKATSMAAILHMVHPEDRDLYTTAIEDARRSCSGYEVEYRLLRADGACLQVREVSDVVLDAEGRLLRSFGYMQDITELKGVSEALRASEEALRRAQRQARIGNWRWDVPGRRLISCSEEYARIHGASLEEAPALMDAQMERVIHPEDRERVARKYRRYNEEAIDYEIEYRIIRADGEVRHVLEIGETLLDAAGKAIEQTGTLQDITERHRIEEALRRSHDELEERVKTRTAQLLESEARYRRIFDTAAVGIGRTRLEDGRVLLSNRRLAQMFGYDNVPTFISDFVFSQRYVDPSERERLLTSYRDRPGAPVECAFLKQDGTPVIVQSHGKPNYEEGFLDFVATDITAQRAAEERLRQAQKMEAVGQLTGGIAHDFNNLLAVIMGNIELLQDRLGTKNQQLAAAYRSAKRGAELTQRLLAFSRQQPLTPQAIDVGGLVTAMSDLLNRSLGETIAIEISRSADLWHAHADPGQVENALLNLALNARDAMPEGGLLTITCSNARVTGPSLDPVSSDEDREVPPGDYVVLAVQDNGHGMSKDVRAHALEPFFTTKEVGQGSGLGLSMVYGFAKQSGGQVIIDSLEGQGTAVRLYLPRITEAGQSTAPETEPAAVKGKGERILVIEDDLDVGALVVTMLQDLNYLAHHAESAAEARQLLAQHQDFALLLSDVVLPGSKSGPALAEEICKDYPGLKVIFMSGHLADAAGGAAALDPGAPFLPKPFRRRQLAQALRDSLER